MVKDKLGQSGIINNMSVYVFNNIFTEEELDLLQKSIVGPAEKYGEHLGRTQIPFGAPQLVLDKLTKIVNEAYGEDFMLGQGGAYVEYSNQYGVPDLPPHFDGDNSDLLIDFQLSANTSWPMGVNLETYPLEDNSAVIFNPNTNIHWRPIKEFKDGEYVKLLFFRGYNSKVRTSYADKVLSQSDPAFDEVRKIRNNLV